jgi:phage terminase large subunit-like protein
VAALYEQGKVKHVGAFPQLEDEMCDFGLEGLSSGRSPDRLDALVWAVTALTGRASSVPRNRALFDDPRLVPSWVGGRSES